MFYLKMEIIITFLSSNEGDLTGKLLADSNKMKIYYYLPTIDGKD